jgi:thiamine pyrophosphokinase
MIIIANGNIARSNIDPPADSIVIAADGGARHCLKLGIKPQVVIGDFDSLTRDELATFEKSGTKLIRYPVDKDETDLELALVPQHVHEGRFAGLARPYDNAYLFLGEMTYQF